MYTKIKCFLYPAFVFFYPVLLSCRVFGDGLDVYLNKDDRVIPDALIVCNKNIIKLDGIRGAPDLIVEVLFPGTAKNLL